MALAGAALAVVALLAIAAVTFVRAGGRTVVRVGSKNFTEQLVLGEIVAGALERWGGVTVERRLNLGGTFICDRAVRAGEIDVYVEYTGTALTAIFKDEVPSASQDGDRQPRSVSREATAACATGMRPRGLRSARRWASTTRLRYLSAARTRAGWA